MNHEIDQYNLFLDSGTHFMPTSMQRVCKSFHRTSSAFFFLHELVSFSPLYAYLCWCLPSSPFMPSLSLGACSSSLYLSHSTPPYCWFHLVFFWICILPDLPQKSPAEAWQKCSSARSVYTEGCHPPEDPLKSLSSKEKVLSQTSDLAYSL